MQKELLSCDYVATMPAQGPDWTSCCDY